jgi:hypothetical protein
MTALSKAKAGPGRADSEAAGPTTGPEGRTTMTAINPIGSMTSTAAYKVADDSTKTDDTRKAAPRGHHGGHHRAAAPAPAPASTSSTVDVTV